MVDMAKTGNPLIAWYTEQKITAHYRAYHPGEGYVVGPARYQWVVRADKSAGMDYVCTVRKEASEDVEFPAYFSDGAVFSQIDGAVRSGCNTYERFKNLLNSELESGATAARLRALTEKPKFMQAFTQRRKALCLTRTRRSFGQTRNTTVPGFRFR